MFGNIQEPFEITSANPLFTSQTRNGLMDQLGLPFVNEHYFKQGEAVKDTLNDFSDCHFCVEWKQDQPRVDITVESPLWDIELILKYNENTALFTLDEAHLVEYNLASQQDKGWIRESFSIQTDDNLHGREALGPVLKVISWAANESIQDDNLTPEAYQSALEKRIKPIKRMLIRQQNEVAHTSEKLAAQI